MTCNAAEIQRLIDALESLEPAMHSLGTPLLADTPTTDALVACGSSARGALEAVLVEGTPHAAMYAAHCLGRIGDAAALPALEAAVARYVAKTPKEGDDFGVISAGRQAIERLGGTSP